MKTFVILVFAFLWSASVSAGEDKIKIIDDFNDFGLDRVLQKSGPVVVIDDLLGFAQALKEGYGAYLEEGRPELEVKISFMNPRTDNERAVVDVKDTGFADDSVKGHWQRFMFKRIEDTRFKLVEYGSKWSCYRGENKDKWIKGLCG